MKAYNSRGMRRIIGCLIALSVLATGCASVDPTDPSHFTHVLIRNDTQSPVVIVQCDISCRTLHDRTYLAAGQSTIVKASNEGIRDGHVVEQLSGDRLGCLYTRFNGVRRTPVVNVSSAQRCR
jgi:hypothetical protein